MSSGSEEERARFLQSLSALADGEIDAASMGLACASWRADVEVRASWHAYHLIGDVMRSDELASDAARDAAFLSALRERLSAEPVVLAPQPEAAAAPSVELPGQVRRTAARWSWMAPAAVAAGFMAVASVLVVTRGTPPLAGGADTLAQSLSGSGAAGVVADATAEPQTFIANGKLVRDARLERYLAAHTQFGGSSALGVPSGFLRAATTQAPDR